MQKIRKAVIPAAGFGTRFLPETKAMPKEMLPIVDKPTIQYIVEEIKASGIEQILIISGHAKRAIEDHFDSSPELEEHLYESGKMDLLKEVRKVASVKIPGTEAAYGPVPKDRCHHHRLPDRPQKRSLLLWHRERRPNRRSESGSR